MQTQSPQIEILQKHLETISDGRVKTAGKSDVDEFLHKSYPDCRLFKNYYNEILAQVEQQVLVYSEVFVPWPKSTFSKLIRETRLSEQRTGIYKYSFYQLVLESQGKIG